MYSLINITTAILKKKEKRFIGPVKPTTYVTKTCFFLLFVLFVLLFLSTSVTLYNCVGRVGQHMGKKVMLFIKFMCGLKAEDQKCWQSFSATVQNEINIT